MTIRGLVIALMITAPLVTPVEAQSTASLEIGSAALSYGESHSAATFSVTPAFRRSGAKSLLATSGTFSLLQGNWSSQAAAALGVYTPMRRSVQGEISLSGGGSGHADGSRTGQGTAVARLHVASFTAGAWMGGGGGTSWDGFEWSDMRSAELGGWYRLADAVFTAAVSPTAVGDTIRYADAHVGARFGVGDVRLYATGGYRAGDRIGNLAGGARSWGSVSARYALSPFMELVASGGSYPVDLMQGFPGGKFVSAGVRLALSGRTPLATSLGTSAEAAGIQDFGTRTDGEQTTIRVRAAGAQSVEVTGDFTGWRPVALAQSAGGWWEGRFAIPSGTHEMNVRRDGGAWVIPPRLTPLADEFGGVVGLLVIR